jgi:hypothetical protein
MPPRSIDPIPIWAQSKGRSDCVLGPALGDQRYPIYTHRSFETKEEAGG